MHIDYMKGISSPFRSSAPQKLHNIVTKEEFSRYNADRLMNTIKFGEEQYGKYTSERLQVKSVSLYATFSHTYVSKNPEIIIAAKKKRIKYSFKKTSKGELGRALLSCVDKDRIQVVEDGSFPAVKGGALIIDFMSVVRRIASVDLKNIKEFGGFGNLILTLSLKYGCNYDKIHLIL